MTQIFMCESCGEPCILHVPEDVDAPEGCPYLGGEHEPAWHEMVPADEVD